MGRYGNFDSGLMQLPFVLGWPGFFVYVGGLFLLARTAFWRRGPRDMFSVAARSIVLMVGAELVFVNTLLGPEGMVFWSFLGLAVAAQIHHQESTP
jgi:hypothetical protein